MEIETYIYSFESENSEYSKESIKIDNEKTVNNLIRSISGFTNYDIHKYGD